MLPRVKITDNFYLDEFSCKCGCGKNNVDLDLIKKIQKIRTDLNQKLVISSGTRCRKRNEQVNGSYNSDHISGKAVDIACNIGTLRRKIVEAAFKYGIPVIGVKKDCVHLAISNPARLFTYDV